MAERLVRRQRGRKFIRGGFWSFLVALVAVVWGQACAPRPVYRPTLSPPASAAPKASPPAPVAPGRHTRPLIEQSRIKEEDLKEKRPIPQARPKDRPARTPQVQGPPSGPAPLPPVSPVPEDSSLIAKITPKTPPQRAASLRLTEEGRRLLDEGDYARALTRLEKTIAIDSTNPYSYYYLAKAHYHLGRYQESLNFLDVAESLFSGEAYWLAEVFALKGENFRALGFLERADSQYSEALRLNPANRVATEGLNHIQRQPQPSAR